MHSDSDSLPLYTGRLIDNGRLYLAAIIGQGSFGVAYKAIDVLDPEPRMYCVKWVGLSYAQRNAPAQDKERFMAMLDREIENHALVSDHPNVVTLHRAIYDGSRSCRWLVMDYISGGDVYDAVTLRNPFWRNEQRSRGVCLQLADAIAYCHERGVYHRDIKPENVLISEDGNRVYLTDFGLSTRAQTASIHDGTASFMCPGEIRSSLRVLFTLTKDPQNKSNA
jgi:serine/threonine protein kinase